MARRKRHRPADRGRDSFDEWNDPDEWGPPDPGDPFWEERHSFGFAFSGRGRPLEDFTGLSLTDFDPAVAAHYGPGIDKTAPRYRGWLLHLIRSYLQAAFRCPRFREAVDRGVDFEKAWTCLPVGELRTIGYFLGVVRKVGAMSSILYEIDYQPFKFSEPEGMHHLLERILPAGGFSSAVRDGLADADAGCRALAASLAGRRIEEEKDPAETEAALAALLHDPDDRARREAALQLAWRGQAAPRVAEVLAEAVSSPVLAEGYWVGEDDHRNPVVFLNALHRLGPEAWGTLDAAAVPALTAFLAQKERGMSSLRAAAAAAVGRLGVVSVGLLQLLAALGRDGSEKVRPAAQAAYAALSQLLAEGRAAVGGGRPDEALLLAVWQDPTSTDLRRVYADWLEEHGQPRRAAWVRLEAEIDALPPEVAQDRWPELYRMFKDWLDSPDGGSRCEDWCEWWARLRQRWPGLDES